MNNLIKNAAGEPLDVKKLMREVNLKARPTTEVSTKNIQRNLTPAQTELVDTLADAGQVLTIIARALEDGFDLSDIFQLLTLEPIVQEIINDFPTALQAFNNLDPTAAKEMVIELKKELISRIGLLDKVVNIVLNAMYAGASTYDFVLATLTMGKKQFDLIKLVPSDISIVPDQISIA